MATINYNGMELEEFTSDKPVAFPKGTRAVFWEDDIAKDIFRFEGEIISYLPYLKDPAVPFNCIMHNGSHATFGHCAILPDPPKPRRATNRELSRWLAQGNGEYKEIITDHDCCMTYFYYSDRGRDVELPKGIKVRKWSDTEWHEPTVDYIRLEDVK
jgi:hypothetical protein